MVMKFSRCVANYPPYCSQVGYPLVKVHIEVRIESKPSIHSNVLAIYARSIFMMWDFYIKSHYLVRSVC